MPTLYTALKARHGQMSKALRAARALEPGAELGRVLLTRALRPLLGRQVPARKWLWLERASPVWRPHTLRTQNF